MSKRSKARNRERRRPITQANCDHIYIDGRYGGVRCPKCQLHIYFGREYECYWPDDDDDAWCPTCQNTGYLDCHCGGDLCVCENRGEYPCPDCSY
jgi:hypothetical protein